MRRSFNPEQDEEERRQRKANADAYKEDLEAQMRQKERRKNIERAEQAERERREEAQVQVAARRAVRGGGGEPFRGADGQIITQMHELKEITAGGAPITGGELLERTKGAPAAPVIHDLIERTRPGSVVAFGGVTAAMPPPQQPVAGSGAAAARGYGMGGGLSSMYNDGQDGQRANAARRYQQELEEQIQEGKARKRREAEKAAAEDARLEAKIGVDPYGRPLMQQQQQQQQQQLMQNAMAPSAQPSYGMPPSVSRTGQAPPMLGARPMMGRANLGGGGGAGGAGAGRRITQPLDLGGGGGGGGGGGFGGGGFGGGDLGGGGGGGGGGGDGGDGGGGDGGGGLGPAISGYTREQQLTRMLEWERERAQERERERTRERERDREREDARQREIERMAQREKEIEKRVRDEEAERRIAYEKRLSDEISSLREDFAARQKMLVQQVEASISRLRYNLLPQAAFGGGATLPNAWERQLRDLLAAAAGKQSPAITMLSPEQPHHPHHPYGQPALHELHTEGFPTITSSGSPSPTLGGGGGLNASLESELSAKADGADPLGRSALVERLDGMQRGFGAQPTTEATLNAPAPAGVGGGGAPAGAADGGSGKLVLESKSSAEEAAERQHLDSLLEDFLNQGADLRGEA